jgi:hypothetical protein
MKRAVALVLSMLMGSLACSISLPGPLGEKGATPIGPTSSVVAQGLIAPTLANGDLATPSRGGAGAPTARAAEPDLRLRAWAWARRPTGQGTDYVQLLVGAVNESKDWWSYEVSKADILGQNPGLCVWSVESPTLTTSEGYSYAAMTTVPCGHMAFGVLPPGVMALGTSDKLSQEEVGVFDIFTFEIPEGAHPESVTAQYKSADSELRLSPHYGARATSGGTIEGDLSAMTVADLMNPGTGQVYQEGEDIPLGEGRVRVEAEDDTGNVGVTMAFTNLHEGYAFKVKGLDLYTSIYSMGVICCRTLLGGQGYNPVDVSSGVVELKVAPKQTQEIHAEFENPDRIPENAMWLILEVRLTWDSPTQDQETHFAIVSLGS